MFVCLFVTNFVATPSITLLGCLIVYCLNWCKDTNIVITNQTNLLLC
nr:MAG TPA: hypothetical protein [Caudoviricetes sp.]